MKYMILLLVYCIAGCSIKSPILNYKIDQNIWLNSELAEVELINTKAKVIINNKHVVNCREAADYSNWFYNQNKIQFAMGKLCGSPYLFLDKPLTNNNIIDFTTAHESFHLLVQFFSMKMPYTYIKTMKGQVGSHHALKLFFNHVLEIYNQQSQVHDKCSVFNKIEKILPDNELAYLKLRLYQEWPAEFYSMSSVYGKNKYNEYLIMRHQQGSDELEYYTSAFAGITTIEDRFGRKKWQDMLYEGYSLYDMYLYSIGCKNTILKHRQLVGVMPNLIIHK